MTMFMELKHLALLRRIARAIERHNELTRLRMDRESDPVKGKRTTPVKITRKSNGTEDDAPTEDPNRIW